LWLVYASRFDRFLKFALRPFCNNHKCIYFIPRRRDGVDSVNPWSRSRSGTCGDRTLEHSYQAISLSSRTIVIQISLTTRSSDWFTYKMSIYFYRRSSTGTVEIIILIKTLCNVDLTRLEFIFDSACRVLWDDVRFPHKRRQRFLMIFFYVRREANGLSELR